MRRQLELRREETQSIHAYAPFRDIELCPVSYMSLNRRCDELEIKLKQLSSSALDASQDGGEDEEQDLAQVHVQNIERSDAELVSARILTVYTLGFMTIVDNPELEGSCIDRRCTALGGGDWLSPLTSFTACVSRLWQPGSFAEHYCYEALPLICLLSRTLPSEASRSTSHPLFLSQPHISGNLDGMVQMVTVPTSLRVADSSSTNFDQRPAFLHCGSTPAIQM